jgi:hypothetical protein
MALLYEKRGEIAYITIDRPRALNALDPETFQHWILGTMRGVWLPLLLGLVGELFVSALI